MFDHLREMICREHEAELARLAGRVTQAEKSAAELRGENARLREENEHLSGQAVTLMMTMQDFAEGPWRNDYRRIARNALKEVGDVSRPGGLEEPDVTSQGGGITCSICGDPVTLDFVICSDCSGKSETT